MSYEDNLIGSTRCTKCGFERRSQLEPCMRCEPFRPLFHELADDVMQSLRDAVVNALQAMQDAGKLESKRSPWERLADATTQAQVCRAFGFDRIETWSPSPARMRMAYTLVAHRGGESATITRSIEVFHHARPEHVIHDMLGEADNRLRPVQTGIALIMRKLEALIVEIDRRREAAIAMDASQVVFSNPSFLDRARELTLAALQEAIKLEPKDPP